MVRDYIAGLHSRVIPAGTLRASALSVQQPPSIIAAEIEINVNIHVGIEVQYGAPQMTSKIEFAYASTNGTFMSAEFPQFAIDVSTFLHYDITRS